MVFVSKRIQQSAAADVHGSGAARPPVGLGRGGAAPATTAAAGEREGAIGRGTPCGAPPVGRGAAGAAGAVPPPPLPPPNRDVKDDHAILGRYLAWQVVAGAGSLFVDTGTTCLALPCCHDGVESTTTPPHTLPVLARLDSLGIMPATQSPFPPLTPTGSGSSNATKSLAVLPSVT